MDRLRQVVILLLIFTLMACLPIFLLIPVPERSEAFVNIIVGWFIAKGGDAIAWLLNSTEQSARRNAANGEALKRATEALAAKRGLVGDEFAIPKAL